MGMYRNRYLFTLEVNNPQYHPKGTVMKIESGYDYSYNVKKEIPFMFTKIALPNDLTPERHFVRSVLQSTKSYDGPVSIELNFLDMMSLAKCLNQRNKSVWTYLCST